MLSMPFNSSTPVFYFNKDAFKKAGLDPNKAPKTWPEFAVAAAKLKASGQAVRLHHRLAVLGADRELQRLAQPADRHQGERLRRPRHRVQVQLAAARRAHRDARPTGRRRAGSPTAAASNQAEATLLQRRVRDADVELGGAGQHPQERQVRLLGQLPAVPPRRQGRAAELDHRRRDAVGDERQEGRRVQGRGQVLHVPVVARGAGRSGTRRPATCRSPSPPTS